MKLVGSKEKNNSIQANGVNSGEIFGEENLLLWINNTFGTRLTVYN